jgi:hypothetical protein
VPLTALTIIQPFAHLIATGVKRVENRTWSTGHRGPLAVHAGKADRYAGRRVVDLAAEYGLDPRPLAYGAIVAVVNVVACVPVAPAHLPDRRRKSIDALGPAYAWMHDHAHAEGPWCHVYELLWRVPEPIACGGKQGPWTVPADVEARLRGMWFADTNARARAAAAGGPK